MFISCNYGDADNALATYQGFEVSSRADDSKELFMTGDPVADFRSAAKYAEVRGAELGDPYCSMSSSVDHFVADCGDHFDWYTDMHGREWFARADDVQSLAEEQEELRVARLRAAYRFLTSLGVPEGEATKRDAEQLFGCSEETHAAIARHLETLSPA